MEMPCFDVYVLGPHHSSKSPQTPKRPARHRTSQRGSAVSVPFSQKSAKEAAAEGANPVLSAPPCLWLPNYITDVVPPPHPCSARGYHDLMRAVATALRCQKPPQCTSPWSLLWEAKTERKGVCRAHRCKRQLCLQLQVPGTCSSNA